jgi:hypothetical protein
MHVSVTVDHHWADIQYLKHGKTWYIYKFILPILPCGIPQVHSYHNDATVLVSLSLNDGYIFHDFFGQLYILM